MTKLLVRIFIKNAEEVKEPKVRAAYGKLSGGVGIVCNVLLFMFKFLIGMLSGSISIRADAVNNLSDACSSIISLLGFKLAEKPADEEHPYGHGRFEYLSGMVVSILIILIGFELLRDSIGKILHPSDVEFSVLIVVILAGSIAVKLWMALFNTSIGKKINSETLRATAADSRNDVISTTGVLAAALISNFTSVELDGYVGVIVALFILVSGLGLVKDTMDPLLGSAPSEEMVESIRQKIMSYPGVLGTHDLMLHDYGPGRQFGSVHVEMPAEMNVLEGHEIIDDMERDFLEQDGIHMIIHYDPIVTSDEKVGRLRYQVNEMVRSIDPVLSIHDLRMVPGNGHTNVIFDCVVPQEFRMSEKELKETISNMVAERYPDYYCVITIDRSFVSMPK